MRETESRGREEIWRRERKGGETGRRGKASALVSAHQHFQIGISVEPRRGRAGFGATSVQY